ncbi:DUF5343 domain-containing protein [Parvularcula maris]|uniref:DUF5343 domain-containing protein n=1 Tax=Parvularcula maris TaxID=2965077 RepID=A0A9X2L8W5_9PROT|nr:DUF5343 domain-containing protein [Parvularcula maris]MCQ8185270.1 DUF5343 domain-containing protein [Parvularcula maris]
MTQKLPYLSSPGSVRKGFEAIISAPTPPKVSQDFVKTKLGIKGGPGDQLTAFFKKIGFAAADGTPTDLYRKFRNKTTRGWAAAEAIRIGYDELYQYNEFMHELDPEELKGLILEVTGQAEDARSVPLTLSTIANLKDYAAFDSENPASAEMEETGSEVNNDIGTIIPQTRVGSSNRINLSYTINLNLPATSDISVFNAIFKSLKENLLKD